MSRLDKPLTISEARRLGLVPGGSVGEQLELDLRDARLDSSEGPWEGVSPRVLTKSYNRFRLGPTPARGLRE